MKTLIGKLGRTLALAGAFVGMTAWGDTLVVDQNITLTDRTITAEEASDGPAMAIAAGKTVTVTFEGVNSFTGKPGYAGIYVPTDSTLIIAGSGKVVATGGNSPANDSGAGAGIGGNGMIGGASPRNPDFGCVKVAEGASVVIEAQGGTGGSCYNSGGGAGIGSGGGSGTVEGTVGSVEIAGGDIKAIGGLGWDRAKSCGGAGIGVGGTNEEGLDNSVRIVVSGGKVYAEGGRDAAGIGGGANCSCKYIEISGGEVEAVGKGEGDGSRCGGAGIGGGDNGGVGTIIITGDAKVDAKAAGTAAGIGTGGASSGSVESIEISGQAEVKAQGGTGVQQSSGKTFGGAAIGAGVNGAIDNIVISDDVKVSATPGTGAQAIGGASSSDPEDVGSIAVSGGEFNFEVPAAYLDGKMTKDESTGKWKVQAVPALITHVGGTTAEYQTLAEALNAVQDGDTVKLGVDADLAAAAFTIAGNVVLDLNGKNIASKGTIAINNGGALKIVNGKSATSVWTWTGMTWLFNVYSGAKLQLEDGVKYDIKGVGGMMGCFVSNMGDVVMNGGEVVQVNPSQGPFSCMSADTQPTLVINGGKVSAPKIVEGGGSDVTIKGGELKATGTAFAAHTVEIVGGEFDLATIAADNADVSISGGTFKKTIPEAFIAPDYGLKEIKDSEGNVIGYGVKSHFDAVMEVKKQGLAFDTRDPNARLVAFSSEDVFQYSLNGWGEQGAGTEAAVTLKLNGVDETETGLTQNEDGTLAWKANKRGMYLFTYTSGTVVEDARFYATDLITQVGDKGEVTATYDADGNVLALNVKLLSDITKQLVINEPVDVTFDMNGQNIMIAESERGNGNVAVVLAKGTTNKVNFIGEGKVQGGDAFEGDSTATGGYAVAYVDADGKYQTDKTGARGTKAATVTFVDGQKGVQLELVSVQQRYPWNGLVDVKYTLSRALTKATYKLTLTVKAGDETVVAKTFTKAGTLASGDNTMIWNANADMPYTVMKDAEVSLKLEIHD